jgi:hypothetical protein
MAKCGMNLFYCHLSLVKGAMNATPHLFAHWCSKNAYISSFLTGQSRNKDHSALVNCGGIEFLKLR